MSLVEGTGLSAADVAAVTGNGGNRGAFFGNDGLFWIVILFLFAMMGGWNNGGFGGNNGGGVVGAYGLGVQDGFNQQAIMSGIGAIQANQNANQMGLISTLNANQIANTQAMNSIAMSLQNCCCENRAGLADLKYTVATENCADRAAVSDGIRDIIANQTANTQAILDKLCQQEIDALKTQNANLQTQLNMANLAASQTAQTARLLQDNAAQTQAIEQYLNPVPIPAYVVQNPNCCQTNYGCGCGVA